MNRVYLGLGANLGDRNLNLQQAIDLITQKIGDVLAESSVYETQPWEFESDRLFLNAVVCVETGLNPLDVLTETQSIEKEIGRTEKTNHRYQDRLIDIDLILYNDLVFNSENLRLPHPLFHQRAFVLEPLNEIAPELVHPVLQKTVKMLLNEQKNNF